MFCLLLAVLSRGYRTPYYIPFKDCSYKGARPKFACRALAGSKRGPVVTLVALVVVYAKGLLTRLLGRLGFGFRA